MTIRFQATCVATMMLIADKNPSVCAFNLPSTNIGAHHWCKRQRVRARSASSVSPSASASTENEPKVKRKRVVHPPTRRLRADIDVSSMDLALSNFAGALSAPPRHGQESPQQSLAHTAHAVYSTRGLAYGDSGPDLLASVQRLAARGNVAEAIHMLTSAPGRLVGGNSASATVAAISSERASSKPDLRAGFTAVLTACANRGMWQEAMAIIVRHMPAIGIQPSLEAWVLAIDACTGAEGSEQAVFLLHEMRSRGAEMSASIYGAAFQACVYGGDTGRAIFLLKDASKRGMSVPPATVANTMRVVSKQESGWNHALSLYYAFLEHTVGQGQAGMVPNTGQGGVDSLGNAKDSYEGILRMRQRLQKISEAGPGLTIVCQAALESCVIGGQWERALEILGTLRAGGGGAQLSREAYGKAIEVCGRCCAWDTVLLLVAEMRSDGIPVSPAAFETALEGCAAVGSWSWARSLLRSMPAEGDDSIPLCDRHYLKALRACATVVDRPGGQGAKEAAIFSLALLQDIREAGWMTGERGKDAYAFAMKTCVRAQDAWSALALLDSAHDDGILQGMTLRTAAMQACSGAGEWRAALSVLEDALAEGVQPGGAAYMAAMAACARGGVVDLALELLDKVLVEHPDDKMTVTAGYHGAITACAECGHWEEASSLLQKMRRDPLVVVTTQQYNAALLACCRARQSFAALSLLGDMTIEASVGRQDDAQGYENGVRPDEKSYNYVMRTFALEGMWRTVIDLLKSMRDEGGLVPGLSSYNLVVEALAKAGEWKRALGMIEEMKREGVRPTEFTYTRCMAVCEKNGQWELALSLMSAMKEQEDLVPDKYAFSTAMMACLKAGRLDDVLDILEEMRAMPGGEGPNLVNYNIAIGACARAREWTRMLKEMDQMRWEDVKPNEMTFAVPLDACARSGEVSLALALLKRMATDGVKPDLVAYSSAVAAACRGGDAVSVSHLLDEMVKAGHIPNEVTYAVAALACRDGANADAAVDLLRRSKEQGLPPDPVVFGFAVQACCNAGDLERGLGLVRHMKTQGLVPDSTFYTSVIAGIDASFSATGVKEN